jgi:hypothetical protein
MKFNSLTIKEVASVNHIGCFFLFRRDLLSNDDAKIRVLELLSKMIDCKEFERW